MQYLLAPVAMPYWLEKLEKKYSCGIFRTDEEKIRFVILLALLNIRKGAGGPFAAALFSSQDHTLQALGINFVVPSHQSCAHAEMTAIANLQNKLQRNNLKGFTLVSSCEPCVMCFGGILWSGVDALLYGAPGEYARAIGFDEGDKVPEWHASLQKRNIRVHGPLLTQKAKLPFDLYHRKSGIIY